MRSESKVLKKMRRLLSQRILLTMVTAFLLLAGMAMLPAGQVHADGVDSATLPSAYKSGYNVYKALDISN